MFAILSPITTVELLCLTTATVFLVKDKNLFWRNNIAYLIVVCLTEMVIGRYVSSKYHNNLWVFNVFVFFEASFISYGIYHCFKKYTNPKVLIAIGTSIIYAFYFGFIIKNGILVFNQVAVSVMSVIFVLYCLYYYYLLLTSEEVPEIRGNPEFWWLTAVLFYYFGSTTVNLFLKLFMSIKIGASSIRYITVNVLNLILYGLWAYSFICRAKQRKSLS